MTSTIVEPAQRIRLHITPFDHSIYERIIPASIRSTQPEVSFHAVQTFPERGFGFLEMSKQDADALKKKLNGSMLKGSKIRIEEARPVKKRKVDEEVELSTEAPRKKRTKHEKDKSKSSKRETVVDGYELPADRHVKRGWTEDNKSHSKTKSAQAAPSKHSVDLKKSKALFKTQVPANSVPVDLKGKKPKEKPVKSGSKKAVIVQEFGKSRNTFAVSSSGTAVKKPAVAYEDGKGWVDEDGQVVEAETTKTSRRRQQQRARSPDVDHTSADARPLLLTSRGANDNAGEGTIIKHATRDMPTSSTTSKDNDAEMGGDASDTISRDIQTKNDISDLSDAESVVQNDAPDLISVKHEASQDEDSDTSEEAAEIEKVQPLEPSEPAAVHPLEALYKRARPDEQKEKPDLTPIDTSFSFFGEQNDVNEPEASILAAPQTPHTKEDLEWRHLRSAAPTPDTAAIDGRFGFPFGDDDDNDDEDEDVQEQGTPTQINVHAKAQAAASGAEESEFRKYFYEHRGDNDRAWKRRRREAKKQQRQRENRRLSRSVV